jgi:hypothetical protein
MIGLLANSQSCQRLGPPMNIENCTDSHMSQLASAFYLPVSMASICWKDGVQLARWFMLQQHNCFRLDATMCSQNTDRT